MLHIKLNDCSIARSVEADDGVIVDVDSDGQIVAVEILNPTQQWNHAAISSRWGLDHSDAKMLEDIAQAFGTKLLATAS